MRTTFIVETTGPACHEITGEVATWLKRSDAADGVLTLMIRHTSASLLIQENADPDVQADLLDWLDRVAPPADDPSMSWLRHVSEGPDDMPAHLKASVLPTSIQIPIADGVMQLGRWQGIYLVEHRDAPHRRQVSAVFLGDRSTRKSR
ncbi:secondary thiamine-phosphate synthase enzyme YjbQ [Paracoccus sp. TK19116]|uniref:Secondary thiamine-phosphate synthase enzyme YjbQ n=1 Tax=Paracoccus albicereus TaxID=2922394 RepID=A0ABT1MNU1_9RHOB|nr:secondary thiamine-phosphate synthase enzyme YjbQ [Paracoccus albicereus]MCQ0969955.1 secondary thiamine-phosphate synthase enzyme YjbQ [Paracoccus albicereus]